MFGYDHESRTRVPAVAWILAACLAGPATGLGSPDTDTPPPSPATTESTGAADTTRALRGNEEGTALRSLTVEAENKVQISFDRPELYVALDPGTAPGLDWGTAQDVLNRTVPDLVSPLWASTAEMPSVYMPRPWLNGFTSGPVARFQPQLEGVQRWRLVVANSQGQPVQEFEGKGKPPKEIVWDGRSISGAPAIPGLTYSYVLEAYDKAGNKRNFVGNGFELPPYRVTNENAITMLLAGDDLEEWGQQRTVTSGVAHPLMLEAASWLNQIEDVQQAVTVTVTARNFDQADFLATRVSETLRHMVLNGPARILAHTDVRPEAPETGAIQIASIP